MSWMLKWCANLQIPPNYIAYPVPEIMDMNPETGPINDMLDTDGFLPIQHAGYMEHSLIRLTLLWD